MELLADSRVEGHIGKVERTVQSWIKSSKSNEAFNESQCSPVPSRITESFTSLTVHMHLFLAFPAVVLIPLYTTSTS